MATTCVWILAGESSGDLYGARLATELRRLSPDTVIRGMGGEAMRQAGVELLVDSSELGVVGLVEVLRHLRTFLAIFRGLVARAKTEKPSAVVLIDYPGFNLRFARQMKLLGVPVVYYISPQVWAWGKRRIPAIARTVRKMLVIFPFETRVYAGTGMEVEFVGHPLLNILAARRLPTAARDARTVLLLPGSRGSEVRRLLQPMLDTAAWLAQRRPDLRFVVAVPRQAIADECARILARWRHTHAGAPAIGIETGATHDWLQKATAGVAASGTVTLECAMLGLPIVAVYRLNPVTYALGRWLVDLPFFTIVNLVTGKRVFEEFLQGHVCAEVLGPALERILPDGTRRQAAEQGMRDAVAAVSGDQSEDPSLRAARAILAVAHENPVVIRLPAVAAGH